MNWDQICERIGQAHGVSAEEVRREMEAALDAAWNRTDKTERMADLQNEIPKMIILTNRIVHLSISA